MGNTSWVNSDQRLSTSDNLAEPFLSSVTKREDFKIGIELEQFLVDPQNFHLLPFDGQKSISSVFSELQSHYHWNVILEKGKVIALKRDELTITLEPGGAFEFVSPPHRTIHELNAAIGSFELELATILDKLQVASLPIGYLPFDTVDSVKLVPKSRYDFMYDYMPEVGTRGREMMKLTSSIQVAIDYQSEEDAMRKCRLAAQATPIFVALSANSLIKKGETGSFASERTDVWLNTDEARSGIPDFQFSKSAKFSDYVNWALSAPIYYLERDSEKLPANGINFSKFLEGRFVFLSRYSNPFPTRSDWEQHLSTLFPWVRLRHYIEIRSFDMGRPSSQRAAAALIKGLFYCNASLDKLEELVGNLDKEAVESLIQAAASKGLDGESEGIRLRDLSRQVVETASDCLERCGQLEERYLHYFEERLENWSYEEELRVINKDPLAYLSGKTFNHQRRL